MQPAIAQTKSVSRLSPCVRFVVVTFSIENNFPVPNMFIPYSVPRHCASPDPWQVRRIVGFVDRHIFLPTRPKIALVGLKDQSPGAAEPGKTAHFRNVLPVVPIIESLLVVF